MMASDSSANSRESRGRSRSSHEWNDSAMLSPAEGGEADSLLSHPPRNDGVPQRHRSDYSTISKLPSDTESGSSQPDSVVVRWRRCCGGRRRFHWYWRERLPKGKASALIFFLNVMESFAFYGATSGALKLILQDKATTNLGFMVTILLEYCAGRLLYPIMGVVADTYIGRHRMIHVSLWLFWLAYGLLAIAFSLMNVLKHSPVVHYVIPITAFVLLSVGAAGFEVNIIPYGMDQLQGASSVEMSSYFYWYYFGRQLGILCGILLFLALLVPTYAPHGSSLDVTDTNSFQAIQPVVALLVLSVALIVLFCLQDWLFKNRERENPLRLVVNVLWYAATAERHLPRYRRAFRYGEGRKPRIELAKINYDGIFPSESVEDVKTFGRIILIIISLGGYFLSYSTCYVMLSYQVSSLFANTSLSSSQHVQTYLYPNLYSVYDVLVVMVTVLLVNYLVLPYLPPSLNMKRRLGCGMLLNIAALFAAALLAHLTLEQSVEQRLLWLFLPATLSALGEMVIFVTGLEFIYAQSPESMKGLLTGVFYCIFGLSSGAGTTVYYFFTMKHCKDENVYNAIQHVHGINLILWYNVIFSLVAVLGFVMYVVVASLYTNRQRPPAPPFDDDWDQSHVHSVFSVRSQ